MSTARRLVLENKLGQRVRTFVVEGDEIHLIYRHDNRRIEAGADLTALDENGIQYEILKTFNANKVSASGFEIVGGGRVRLTQDEEKQSPTYELNPDNDNQKLQTTLKKSAIGHVAVIALILLASFFFQHENTNPEPQLVTIVVPPKVVPPQEKPQVIPVAEKKIVPPKVIAKVSPKKIPPKVRPVVRPVTHAVAKVKPVIQNHKPMVVHSAKPQNLNNVGALAALGGVKNGTKGYQGLDTNSLKNIRSAGAGTGGGGVGSGAGGGMRGVLPGNGLIAGSSGSGGRAEGAGGYGTRGAGGGRAGYGKISLVGNTSGISLPMDDEATVEGGLDRDQIAAVINKNKGQIIYCYEQGLQGQPSLNGRVSVAFIIGANGRISTAKVAQTSLRSAQVENCMLAKMKSWQFPHPVGNVNVDVLYPFELRRVTSR